MSKFHWNTETIFSSSHSRRDDFLTVMVMFKGAMWSAVALSSAAAAKIRSAKTAQETMSKVFDNHAHDVVGVYATPGEAFTAAEKYATAWLKKKPKIKACDCGPIGAPKVPQRKVPRDLYAIKPLYPPKRRPCLNKSTRAARAKSRALISRAR